MKDFAIIVTYDDGSKAINGFYKSAKTAINVAKGNNDCQFLHYDYSVIQLSTRKTIYKK